MQHKKIHIAQLGDHYEDSVRQERRFASPATGKRRRGSFRCQREYLRVDRAFNAPV